MSLWSDLARRAGQVFASHASPEIQEASVPARVSNDCGPDVDDVGFTAAVVGLGAKLAKADGLVTEDEVKTFTRVFRARPEDAASVERVFNLARQTVRGYESYASRIGKRYSDRPCLLEGVLDGLFQIALADGVMTLDELEYLRTVSDRFGFSDMDFKRIKASHMGADPGDPYAILGVTQDAPYDEIRVAYRQLMMDHHPDRLVAAKFAPPDFEPTAHEKAAAITSAFAKIRAERGMIVRAD
ncbi:MAG: molecular chaperone DjlA [Hirschia sp.]|nr:molecular chaperone DjlA [Hirschia sp.]MBF18499.1 molecular chaperone DjlA [Hirschia sp.]